MSNASDNTNNSNTPKSTEVMVLRTLGFLVPGSRIFELPPPDWECNKIAAEHDNWVATYGEDYYAEPSA